MSIDDRIHREEMLRRAVLSGDEAAWRAWCLEVFDELDRFVAWRCGGRRDQADDLVQETWLTAIRTIRRFDPERGRFLAWLRGIAANLRRNQLRTIQRQLKRESRANGHADSPTNTDDEHSTRAHNERQIAAALDALSERHEAVLRAKYFDGLSVADIAAAWNETPKAIESLLTRARQAFREQFEQLRRE